MRIAPTLALAGSITAGLVAMVAPAAAQSINPMRGEIRTFSDQFAVRVFPGNPYQRPMRVEVKVYDDKFAPIEAVVTPSAAVVSPQDNRSVLVVVPLEGRLERRVRICAESVPYKNNTSRLRTQVCGHFIAYRMQ